jgi:hypothetical protein
MTSALQKHATTRALPDNRLRLCDRSIALLLVNAP